MEPRFLKCALLLLFLTIVMTEGLRGPSSRIDDEKSTAVRARVPSRHGSRSFTPSRPSSETTETLNSEATTPKATRRAPGARRASSSRFGAQTTSSAASTEQTITGPRIEAAIHRNSNKSKASPQKVYNHGAGRFASRKFVPKMHDSEPEKSDDSTKDNKDRRYLPDGSTDNARAGRAQEIVEGIEAPKFGENSRTGGRRSFRLNGERSKSKLENPGPSIFQGTAENTRSRTGRKIQSHSVLSGRQLKSSVPSSSRYSRDRTNESEADSTTETVKSNRRSFKHEPSDARKKLVDSRLKHDITASGSESVRINIPLNFEDSKRLGDTVSVDTEGPSIEIPKRSIGSRYKPRGRQASRDKKLEVEVTTAGNLARSTSRRGGGGSSTAFESTTEAALARGRGRNHESRKSSVAPESSFTTASPELRRRNFNAKSLPRGFEASRAADNRVSEAKAQSLDSRKPNRPRGRYRVDVSTTRAPAQTLPTLGPDGASVVTFANFGTITPSYEPEITVTTSQPTMTTPRVQLPTTVISPATLNSEISRRDTAGEGRSHQNAGQRRRSSKEDFFNHGLGFRGRRPPYPVVDEVPVTVTTTTTTTTSAPVTTAAPRPENAARGNPGWTLRRRPGHWHDGPSSGPSANPAESPILVEQDRGTTTTLSSTTKGGRRGNKTFVKGPGGGTKEDIGESDNYPPDFKARLAQLQKANGQPRTPLEERRLHTSSNVIGTANADLELASSDNAYLVVAQTAFPNIATLLSLPIPSPLDEQQASKMSSAELFAARSRMKLENARKLVKPELLIDETSARQVIVDPSPKPKEDADQNPSDSDVDEGQKVFKVARKSIPSTEKPQLGQKSSTKSDWKPSKLRKNLKEGQSRTSRYKQATLYTPKVSSTTPTTEKNTIEENDVEHTTKSRVGRYLEQKYKFGPKPRGSKLRGPKPSNIEGGIHEEHHPISSTKSPLVEKARKMFIPRKNDKSYVEDIKAVALKLRKTLENMEKSQTPRPARRGDFSEGSTTLLTTMRTVKSFSFSTRLVKMDDNESATSSTMKMVEDEISPTPMPTSTSSSFLTEIGTQNPAENEVTTSGYDSILFLSTQSSSSDDIINEIENSSASSTSESSSAKSTRSPEDAQFDWKELRAATESVSSQVDYKPRAAALTNDSGSPVYVVYPSATEKPLSIAITPKVYRYHATVKPDEFLAGQQQQSVTQDPIISVKVSSGGDNSLQGPVVDSNNAASGNIASTNIFNPSKSAAILETGNSTILEQLRSTVAPLLSTLGAKSPVFAGVYKNTNSANSLPRVTSSGVPPRFSARYRGAELFVRRPTPPTNSLSENSDSAKLIDVSSPGEPKVLTFYQAVETASINNEQTDVRQLWQLGRAAQVENTTANDPNGTNSSNSDLPSIIPVTVTNTINDIGPPSTDNVTTLTPNTTKTTETVNSPEMTQQPKHTLEDNEPEQITATAKADISTILNRLTDVETTTEKSMFTSTELITEVSISISDNLNQNNLFTTTSPSLSTDVASLDLKNSEAFTTWQSTISSSEGSSTEMPFTSSTLLDDTESIISMTITPPVTMITEVANSRIPKKLDDSNSEQPQVSNSLLDITLPGSNNETTKHTFVEIQIEQEPMRTTKLEILSQVKASTTSDMHDKLNFTSENTTRKLEVLAMISIPTADQSSTQTVEDITVVSKSSQMKNSLTVTSTTTEAVPENLFHDISESAKVTETSITDSPSNMTTQMGKENEKVTTTQMPETLDKISEENDTVFNNTPNSLDVEIQFSNVMNETVPAGTEKLSPTKDLFSNEDMQSAFEKFLYSAINSKENITSNDFFNNSLMAELMKIVKRISENSTNTTQSSISLDENNVDSSPDGLPQLLGGFLDNTNKTQSVTNDSTVETNNETSVVAQTTNIPFTTIPSELITNSINTDTNTEIDTSSSIFTTQSNNEILETTTFNPITTVPTSDNQNSDLTNITNITSVNTPYITRMLQIFAKLLDAKLLSEIPTVPQPQELGALTPNSTEPLPIVEDLTKTALMDDSTNQVPTAMSIESQTSPDLTTIAPTLLTRFQDSTPATAQRTAGINIQPDQTFITFKPAINYPSSFVSSSTTVNTNDVSAINPKSTVPAETTTIPENNLAYVPSSTFSPTTTGSPAIFSTYTPATQQSSTTVSYAGRFGTSRLTPAPKFSSSSSTTAPLRDYLIYGIYPNKTIVRKRPEDNLIDPRNVDSPYVIFGIYPDGKLVRKFPNGTVIPDPPSNPVEVVFSLSTTTTTTNRPRLTDNQAINQGMRNQKVDFSNNRSPVADVNTQNAFYAPNEVDNALGFSGPTGFDLPIGSVGSDTKETTPTTASVVAENGSHQGSRIIQDRTRDEATRTSEGEGQRNSVFIGQDKFVNYWTNDQPNSPPTVLSININSAATATKEGSLSPPPRANFDILPNSQSGNQVTAPPGFPWKDPLDQIFGITTDTSAITASVASNTIDDSNAQNAAISARPINNFVEIFSPVSSTINSLIKTPTKATTSTTTLAPTTQASTTTTTMTTQAPTTSSPPAFSTTAIPITMNPNLFGTTFDDLAFLNALLEKPSVGEGTPKTLTEVEQLLANKILSLALGRPLTNGGPTRSPKAIQPSNVSPNSVSEDKGFRSSTSSPSFVDSTSQPIVIDLHPTISTRRPTTTPFTWKPVRTFSSYEDPTTTSTTTTTPHTTTTAFTTTTPRTTTSTTTTTTTTTTPRPTTTSTTSSTTTTSTTRKSTTRVPVIITAKPITTRRPKPRPTTQVPPSGPFAFAANLLQSIFGRNPFAQATTPRPVVRRPPPTARRVVPTTHKPTTTSTTTTTPSPEPQIVKLQSSHTPRSIQLSNDAVHVTNGQQSTISNTIGTSDKTVEVTPKASGAKQATTTYSPEDDAKFLAALLNVARDMGGTGGGGKSATGTSRPALDADDEAFLHAILSGQQAKIQPLGTVGGNDQNDAALLAAFLKAQGIEPSTPRNSLVLQLQHANLGKTTSTTTKRPTTTTTRRTTTTQHRPPSSTYPPPLFSNFGVFSSSSGGGGGDGAGDSVGPSPGGQGMVRSQVVNAAIGMTRAFGQFLGAAITGAAQQFQSFVRNGTSLWG